MIAIIEELITQITTCITGHIRKCREFYKIETIQWNGPWYTSLDCGCVPKKYLENCLSSEQCTWCESYFEILYIVCTCDHQQWFKLTNATVAYCSLYPPTLLTAEGKILGLHKFHRNTITNFYYRKHLQEK